MRFSVKRMLGKKRSSGSGCSYLAIGGFPLMARPCGSGEETRVAPVVSSVSLGTLEWKSRRRIDVPSHDQCAQNSRRVEEGGRKVGCSDDTVSAEKRMGRFRGQLYVTLASWCVRQHGQRNRGQQR